MPGARQPGSWDSDAGSLQGFAFTPCNPGRIPGNVVCWDKENPILLQAGPSPHHGLRDGN